MTHQYDFGEAIILLLINHPDLHFSNDFSRNY